jgi:hypothetical protein
MVRAVLLSGVVGFVFLLVLAFATDKAAYSSAAPVASIVGAVLGSVVQKIFLFTLFTASTIMPALLYAGTTLLYIATRRGHGVYGRWEWPIVAGAVIWLAYELIVLIGPGAFRDAQYYVAGALGIGLVFYIVQLITEPAAMRVEPGTASEVPAE